MTETIDSKDIFLSPDERYDVSCVKSSKRPHLLETYYSFDGNPTKTPTGDDGEEEELPLPLMDGCNIPTWRAEQMIRCSSRWEAMLNVGLGCSLLRREQQLPL